LWLNDEKPCFALFGGQNKAAYSKLNPDEQVWNEIKNNRIGKQPVKN